MYTAYMEATHMNKKDMHTVDPITCKCVPNCRRCKLIKMRSLPMPTEQFIVRSTINPALVLCTDGEYHAEGIHTGPGAWAVKVYKTERGAKRAAGTDGLRKAAINA